MLFGLLQQNPAANTIYNFGSLMKMNSNGSQVINTIPQLIREVFDEFFRFGGHGKRFNVKKCSKK